MTIEEKEIEIKKYLLAEEGISSADEIASRIAAEAAVVTPVVAESEGLTTEIDKAYFTLSLAGKVKKEKADVTPVTQTVPAQASAPVSNHTAAELSAITQKLKADMSRRLADFDNWSIPQLYTIKAAPADLIPEGTTFQATMTPEKFKSTYKEEDVLPEDKPIYQAILTKLENKESFKAFINDKFKAPINGCKVAKGEGKAETFCKDDLVLFLATEVCGKIPSSENTAGATIKKVTVKQKQTQNGAERKADKVVVTFTKAADRDRVLVSDVLTTKTDRMVRSEECFRIAIRPDGKNVKLNGKGEPMYRKVRISGKAPVYDTVIKSDFTDVFRVDTRDKSAKCPKDRKEIDMLLEAATLAIADYKSNFTPGVKVDINDSLQKALNEYMADTTEAAPVGAAV